MAAAFGAVVARRYHYNWIVSAGAGIGAGVVTLFLSLGITVNLIGS